MPNWLLTFLVVGLIAGLLGLSGLAGTATQIAWIMFVVFLILHLISLVAGRRIPPRRGVGSRCFNYFIKWCNES